MPDPTESPDPDRTSLPDPTDPTGSDDLEAFGPPGDSLESSMAPAYRPPDVPTPEDRAAERRLGSIEDAVVLVSFLVAGVVGAVVWWRVAPSPAYTRTKDNAVMTALQFGRQAGIDGSYAVIALIAAVIVGGVLAWWRRTDPLRLVGALLIGSIVAAAVMLLLGGVLGPPNPKSVIDHLQPGQKAAVQLKPVSYTVLVFWPLGALLSAGLVLLWTTGRGEDRRRRTDLPQGNAVTPDEMTNR